MQDKLLEVTNLVTRFHTDDGVVTAVNNLCFDVKQGKCSNTILKLFAQ